MSKRKRTPEERRANAISRVTDKILPVVIEWQPRPLESIYPIVFMDAVHFHVRSEGQMRMHVCVHRVKERLTS